jgi:hypothetical protein
VKKKTDKQSVSIFIPVSQLGASWKGELDRLPANQTFDLVLDYPFGGAVKHHFPIKTGKRGLGLIGLLGKIGQAYEKIYENPDDNGVFGHDIYDLQLSRVNVNFKTKVITLDVDS